MSWLPLSYSFKSHLLIWITRYWNKQIKSKMRSPWKTCIASKYYVPLRVSEIILFQISQFWQSGSDFQSYSEISLLSMWMSIHARIKLSFVGGWHAVCWTWHGYHMHDHTAAVVTCTRSTQLKLKHRCGRWSPGPGPNWGAMVNRQLLKDREPFFLEDLAPGSGWPYNQTHKGNTNQTQLYKNKQTNKHAVGRETRLRRCGKRGKWGSHNISLCMMVSIIENTKELPWTSDPHRCTFSCPSKPWSHRNRGSGTPQECWYTGHHHRRQDCFHTHRYLLTQS